jgi:hypothetical protein
VHRAPRDQKSKLDSRRIACLAKVYEAGKNAAITIMATLHLLRKLNSGIIFSSSNPNTELPSSITAVQTRMLQSQL